MKISRILLTVASLLLAGPISAQITPRNLLKNHSAQLSAWLIPHDNFTPITKSAEEWRNQLPDTAIKTIIANGEAALKKPFNPIPATVTLEYVRTGNRTHYEQLSFDKRNELWNLVLAETVESKGRFTDHIADGVWSICEESFWGINAHIGAQKAGNGLPDVQDPIVDLFAAETSSVLAWTDYLVGDKLDKVSKLIRPRIYAETNRRIFTPMLTAKYSWMGGKDPNAKLNNWAPWVMSNYIIASLLLEKDQAKRVNALNIAIRVTDQYINGLGDDGGCDEGPSYWFAAGGATFDVLQELYDATGGKLNIFHEPFVQKIAAYIYKTHIAGSYFINVADAHPRITPDGIMIWRFGKAVGDARMAAFGSWAFHNIQREKPSVEQFQRPRVLYNLFAAKAVAADNEKYTEVPDAWFNDVKLMAARTNNGLFVSAHAGNNGESHNHNDVGDFTVYADGSPVLIDVGSGTYTARTFSGKRYDLWFNTSPYHNLPTIGEVQQSAGINYTASQVKYSNTKSASSLQMDIAGAYPATAGVKKLLRNLAVNKSGKVTVTDSYVLNKSNTVTQSFMTVCPTDISSPGVIVFTTPGNGKVMLNYDANLWLPKVKKIELTSPEDQGLKNTWDHRDIYRVVLTSKKLFTNQIVTYFIHK